MAKRTAFGSVEIGAVFVSVAGTNAAEAEYGTVRRVDYQPIGGTWAELNFHVSKTIEALDPPGLAGYEFFKDATIDQAFQLYLKRFGNPWKI